MSSTPVQEMDTGKATPLCFQQLRKWLWTDTCTTGYTANSLKGIPSEIPSGINCHLLFYPMYHSFNIFNVHLSLVYGNSLCYILYFLYLVFSASSVISCRTLIVSVCHVLLIFVCYFECNSSYCSSIHDLWGKWFHLSACSASQILWNIIHGKLSSRSTLWFACFWAGSKLCTILHLC